MKLTEIEKLFEPVGLIRGGVFLLRDEDALRFIEECERRGVPILGVEGFRVQGQMIQPFQEHSFDLERVNPDSHRIAKDFIADRLHQELWFEVVAADRINESAKLEPEEN